MVFISATIEQNMQFDVRQSRQINTNLTTISYILQMGRTTKKDKQPQPESESQQVEEQEDLDQEDEDEALNDPYLNDQEDLREQQLLAHINQRINASKDGEQLTWAALYSLKKKEIDINEQMNEEIEKIRDKYELLKQPIYKQISAVALGSKVDETLYKPQGLEIKTDPKKHAPTKIEDFWGIVFEKQGLLSEQVDVDCFSKLKQFTCELVDHEHQRFKISAKFSEQTEYFSNLELALDIRYDPNSDLPIRQIKYPITYKKTRAEHSFFTQLFDSVTEVQETMNVAGEIYQDYNNALYFYFREEDEEEDGGNNEEQEREEDDDDEDEEVQPVKKNKPNAVEKPECKQQ